jgi:hypothetical protein
MARPPSPSLAVLIVLARVVGRPGLVLPPMADLSDGGQVTVSAVITFWHRMFANVPERRRPRSPLGTRQGSSTSAPQRMAMVHEAEFILAQACCQDAS